MLDRLRQAQAEEGRVDAEDLTRTAGVLLLHDPVRPDAPRTVRRLRDAGFTRLVMLTGDQPRVAAEVARVVGAFLQEGVDVVVILNALRTLVGGVQRDAAP